MLRADPRPAAYLVYLSHIPAYCEEGVLNRRLLRWQPETLVQLPEGLAALRGHHLVV
jgi:hypothetical protein